jgi:ribosomal protein S27AE
MYNDWAELFYISPYHFVDAVVMDWKCVSCGWAAKTNRQKCPRCGSALWKPASRKNLIELSGPMKRIAPKGLLLANPGRQAPIQDSNGIECGKCHVVIYPVGKGFDAKAFQDARNRHYSISPACKEKQQE